MKKTILVLLAVLFAFTVAGCSAKENGEEEVAKEPLKIGVPDDGTNLSRAIKLLETAGLLTVDPEAGYTPEIADITGYLYNITVEPVTANTLPATLDDFAASTINGTYAIPAGLIPSKDALIIEQQSEDGDNPFVNIIVSRTEDKDNATYKTIVEAYQTDLVAAYLLAAYNEAFFPAFAYDETYTLADTVDSITAYRSIYKAGDDGVTVVKVGVCGANNNQWYAVQKVLDEKEAKIVIELVEFDAYTLPNEALNSGEIDLNAFQHKAFLNNEIANCGYDLTVIGDTLIAPLSLYSKAYDSIDALKEAAGAIQ